MNSGSAPARARSKTSHKGYRAGEGYRVHGQRENLAGHEAALKSCRPTLVALARGTPAGALLLEVLALRSAQAAARGAEAQHRVRVRLALALLGPAAAGDVRVIAGMRAGAARERADLCHVLLRKRRSVVHHESHSQRAAAGLAIRVRQDRTGNSGLCRTHSPLPGFPDHSRTTAGKEGGCLRRSRRSTRHRAPSLHSQCACRCRCQRRRRPGGCRPVRSAEAARMHV